MSQMCTGFEIVEAAPVVRVGCASWLKEYIFGANEGQQHAPAVSSGANMFRHRTDPFGNAQKGTAISQACAECKAAQECRWHALNINACSKSMHVQDVLHRAWKCEPYAAASLHVWNYRQAHHIYINHMTVFPSP